MRTRPQVCQALLFALALQTGVCYGIKWLALSKTPAALALNQTQHCKQLEGLVSAQVQLCRSNLELMHTIVHAAREAMKACRRAFADMRWNCSSIELAPNYLLDLERGTRESAFVYALSAAAISHAIARACTSGDLPGCSCGPVPGEPPGPGNRWGGCADNLSYGLLMGAKFSDAPMKVKKTGSQANKLMRLHNSEVGRQLEEELRTLNTLPALEQKASHLRPRAGGDSLRAPSRWRGGAGPRGQARDGALAAQPDALPCPQALRASLEMKCKCHGVSGSCSIRTCWKGLQELRDVATDLKTRYLSATKVVHRPMGTRKHLVPKDLDIRPVKDSELVYLQSSPDFCMKNEKVGSHGTQDRQCNKTSHGSDSCDLMCCGRGYNPYTDRVVERCHCKYHWCCYVTCRRCERTVERYVCK
ncbi:Protein Wnt-11 [Camelus dromedarius]|uniref:Protein Wnt n=1 Tax=Camelus dromedarius TaxID=9838 RepID=A0A5N4DLR5_CAMDR|nr:Protein Wnt-11 [Camelus dromedarius]